MRREQTERRRCRPEHRDVDRLREEGRGIPGERRGLVGMLENGDSAEGRSGRDGNVPSSMVRPAPVSSNHMCVERGPLRRQRKGRMHELLPVRGRDDLAAARERNWPKEHATARPAPRTGVVEAQIAADASACRPRPNALNDNQVCWRRPARLSAWSRPAPAPVPGHPYRPPPFPPPPAGRAARRSRRSAWRGVTRRSARNRRRGCRSRPGIRRERDRSEMLFAGPAAVTDTRSTRAGSPSSGSPDASVSWARGMVTGCSSCFSVKIGQISMSLPFQTTGMRWSPSMSRSTCSHGRPGMRRRRSRRR